MDISNKARIVVLYASTYNMINEKQEQVKGCSVKYLFWGEDGEKLYEQSEWDINKPVGVQTAKCSMDYELRTKMPFAPALYEGTFEMTVGGDGKPVMKLRDVAFISTIRIEPNVVSGLSVPGMVSKEVQDDVMKNFKKTAK